MLLPISLLKTYLPKDVSLKIIIENLTRLGIEVEKIENEKPAFSDVVVAEVKEVQKHPSADKLQVATVFDGENTYQVVCGAPNCRAGLKTAFARIGAEIGSESEAFKIKKAKLRGVESFGMLCSAKELGISAEDDGIMELTEKQQIGQNLAIYFHDPILDLSLTPNLGHCLSVIGIARELAASLNQRIKYPAIDYAKEKELKTSQKAKVEILDKRCKRYSGLYIENITVGPSPRWLEENLQKSGFQSINNIVDITNFILLEMGQPLHAFDTAKIQNMELAVESAQKEFDFLGLDNTAYKVPKGTMLIKDKEKVLALGGILGGQDSAVSAETKNIFLEAACFDPVQVRKSCQALQLRTESSLRFEKATDPNATLTALKRAAHLILQVCPSAKIASDFIDLQPMEIKEKTIFLQKDKVNRILGTNLAANEIASILERLELKTKTDDSQLFVTVPTFRNDIKSEIDLIEEVARIFGYNQIEKRQPVFSSSMQPDAPFYVFEQALKNNLIAQGLKEIISPDLISFEMANITHEKEIPPEAILTVKKAKSKDNSVLRPTLLSSHLQIIQKNFDHKNFDLQFFENSKVHFQKETAVEEPILAITLTGKKAPLHFQEKPVEIDFFDLKGQMENLLASLNIVHFSFTPSHHSAFHPGRQAHLIIENAQVATLGALHPLLLQKFDLKKDIYFAEINSHLLFQFSKNKAVYEHLAIFPSSERDFTFTANQDLAFSALTEEINKARPALLESFFLLDLYKDAKLQGKQNLTLRFVYRDLKKTVSFEEVEKAHAKITDAINKKFLST